MATGTVSSTKFRQYSVTFSKSASTSSGGDIVTRPLFPHSQECRRRSGGSRCKKSRRGWPRERQDSNLRTSSSCRISFRDLAASPLYYILRKTKALYNWFWGDVMDEGTMQDEVMLVEPYFSIPVIPTTTVPSNI
uniref:Uncharacterized protein n=1 Tax=Nelumbo nucifera TaxID=4432 RepID=A0A822XTN1_NELNU|nr:TPA_asm: hypothetical protein HUJ06_026438 [Nelumbo nucifera]